MFSATISAQFRWVILLLPLMIGCRSKAKVADSPYYPLQLGTLWVYRSDEGAFYTHVAKHEKVGTHVCAYLETIRGKKIISTEHIYTDKDGIYIVTSDRQRFDPPLKLLEIPPVEGTRWTRDLDAGEDRNTATFTIGKTISIETPAGKFRAVLLRKELQNPRRTFDYWFAKKVGIVKQSIASGDARVDFYLEKWTLPD